MIRYFRIGDFIVGIDESNHGKFPEIFVAVASGTKSSAKKVKPMEKVRSLETIDSVLAEWNYVHMVMKEKSSKEEYRILRSAYISQLILHYHEKRPNKELTVIIDGRMDNQDIASIILATSIENLDIRTEPDADRRYKIVNVADQIANYLWKYYNREPDGDKYKSTLLIPSEETYEQMAKLLAA